jgi:hypothetical protein
LHLLIYIGFSKSFNVPDFEVAVLFFFSCGDDVPFDFGESLVFNTAFALAAAFLGGALDGVTVLATAGSDFLFFETVSTAELAGRLLPPETRFI